MNRDPGFGDAHALEAALRDLSVHVEFPRTPPIADAVAARLRLAPALTRSRRPQWLQGRRALAFAIVLLVIVAGTLAVIPGTRTAIANLLGFEGVSIEVDGSRPAPPLRFDRAGLGRAVTLAEARRLPHFRLRVLDSAQLGTPEIYFAPFPAGGQVTFVYPASDGLPESEETGVGLIFTQFRADISDDVVVHKNVDQGVQVEVVDVGGNHGYWVEGRHAFFGYIADNDIDVFHQPRAAGNALLWQDGGMTYRIEGALTRSQALALATSLR